MFCAKSRSRFVVARSLLRNVLSSYIGDDPNKVLIGVQRGGKPFVHGVSFNVAHTSDVAMIAVTKGAPIGIDVELCNRRLTNVSRLARTRLSPGEYRRLIAECDGDEEEMRRLFLELWTRKEAFVKCTGEGIARDLRSFEIGVDEIGEPAIISVDGCVHKATQWSIKSLRSCVGGTHVFASVVADMPEIRSLCMFDVATDC